MRLLVAGRRARAVARAAGAFADDVTIEAATTKIAAIALLGQAQFDLILACERLDDGSGLEVLSYVAVNTPNTLRIFAARPSTLSLLKGELGSFGLFRTIPYPINFRKVWSALDLVRSCCVEWDATRRPRRLMRRVPHVVLESAWEAEIPRPTASPPEAAAVSSRPTAPADVSSGPRRRAPVRASPGSRAQTRIPPQSEAFKRALARRNEVQRRRGLSVSDESLAHLARQVMARRPTVDSRAAGRGRTRTALFVGSGVVAAGTAALLTFFMQSSNDSIQHPALLPAAAGDRPVSEKVLPWLAPTPQPAPTTFVASDTLAPAPAAMEVKAQAEEEEQQEAEAEVEFERSVVHYSSK